MDCGRSTDNMQGLDRFSRIWKPNWFKIWGSHHITQESVDNFVDIEFDPFAPFAVSIHAV